LIFELQRKWALLSTNETLRIKPYNFDVRNSSIAKITLYVDYMQKTNASDTLNTDEMAKEFICQFPRQSFTVGQMVCAIFFVEISLFVIIVFFNFNL